MMKCINKIDIKPLIEELMVANNGEWLIPDEYSEREEMLQSLMTITMPWVLSDGYYELEGKYLKQKFSDKEIVDIDDIKEVLVDNIYLYKGDITAIKADAIVNAANEKLLGYFVLELAEEQEDIKNVVFCSISTGIYGVPIELAAKVAVETISDYMNCHDSSIEKVVIDVFSDEDYAEYKGVIC